MFMVANVYKTIGKEIVMYSEYEHLFENQMERENSNKVHDEALSPIPFILYPIFLPLYQVLFTTTTTVKILTYG